MNDALSPDAPSLRDLFPGRTWPSVPEGPPDTFRDRTVLVTGAGGTLGRVLVRVLRQTEARSIVAVDTDEHRLADLEARFGGALEGPPVRGRLADLRRERDRRRCLAADPDVAIHAAAYKRVPFLEGRPLAAAENNLLAVAAWARACRRAGVERFVFVSTDKAARPTSVMGQTKRGAEEWLRAAEGTEAPPVTIARLCNLFGSRGSVVPRFRRRLQAGRPVPVTHPKMKRWIMRPVDGAQSVLAAAGQEPGTYVPTACLRVSIPVLARRLIRYERPGGDPEEWIEWTDPRPGERLRERRWGTGEAPVCSGLDGLWRLERPPPGSAVRGRVEALFRACAEGEETRVRALLEAMVSPVREPDQEAAPKDLGFRRGGGGPAVGTGG